MRTSRIKLFFTTLAIFLICLPAFPFQVQALTSNPTTAAEDEAHIVVQFNPGHQIVRTVPVSAPLSGLEALLNTGLEVITTDFGSGFIAVCSIGGVGCPADDCFCSSKFWNYEFWDGSNWQGYMVGAADSSVNAGDVEGWRWAEFGEGTLAPAQLFLAVERSMDWLADQQNELGTYGNVSSDVETLLAIGANDYSARTWRASQDGVSLLVPVMTGGPGFTKQGAGQSGKFAVGLTAADGCWPYGALKPSTYYNSITGQYDLGAFNQSWAVLGTLALGESVPEDAIHYLRELVQPDGGWEWSPGLGSDTNSTSLVIQALIAAGEVPTSTLVLNGLDYLKTAQNPDAGFTYDPESPWGTNSDTNSTAYTIQAILAAGQDPTQGMWVVGDANPLTYLLEMQLPDGSFEWQPGLGSNLMATQQAIPALLGRVFPLKTNEAIDCPAFFMPLISQNYH